MKVISLFLYEFTHFRRSRSKVISYLLFVLACLYSVYTGFDLQSKQQDTIDSIAQKQQEEIDKILTWFDEGKKGPADRSWVDISQPYWSLRSTPTYTMKTPSALLPLGIGQAEHYGYYKKITFWSSTYDNDMVEEISNPERLVNGNIDFSFLIIYLLPVLLIILTYNLGGLERDAKFERLIAIQSGSVPKWLLTRFLFYVLLLLSTVIIFMIGVAFLNNGLQLISLQLGDLILLFTIYMICFAWIFFAIILNASGSSTAAFQLIGAWLLFWVVVPGAVHQYASLQYPVSYMTDFLDVNRKETYATYSLPSDVLFKRLLEIYPTVNTTELGQDSKPDKGVMRRSVGAIINQMNKTAIAQIEQKNEAKNQLIRSSYWFNPIAYVQNQWNVCTSSDYYAYKNYRQQVQQAIDAKMKMLVFETWNKKQVDKASYEQYLKILK